MVMVAGLLSAARTGREVNTLISVRRMHEFNKLWRR
jgi:hypothetical protein